MGVPILHIYELNNDDQTFVRNGDPATGMFWYRSDTFELKSKQNGVTRVILDANGNPPNLKTNHNVFTRTFSDFSIAGTVKQVSLFNLPPKGEVVSVTAEVTTAWNGPDTVTLSCGRAATQTELLIAQNAKTTGFKDSIGTALTSKRGMFSSSGNTDIVAEAVSTGGNLSTATQGSVTFYVTWIGY